MFVLDTPLMVYIRVIPSIWSEEANNNPFAVAQVTLYVVIYSDSFFIALCTFVTQCYINLLCITSLDSFIN